MVKNRDKILINDEATHKIQQEQTREGDGKEIHPLSCCTMASINNPNIQQVIGVQLSQKYSSHLT